MRAFLLFMPQNSYNLSDMVPHYHRLEISSEITTAGSSSTSSSTEYPTC